jgi:methylated-DNA-[protein]-cysteine S-methyltransferase
MGTVNQGNGKRLVYKWMDSPVGRLKLTATSDGLAAILWETDGPDRVRLGAAAESPAHALLIEVERQLTEYFAGRRTTFDLPLDCGGTPFQRSVWEALRAIPFGETRSYAEIARQVGRPRAVRAAGAANGRNPIAIVTPCHRVIGAGGQLTGFAGGLEAKAYLLSLERRHA